MRFQASLKFTVPLILLAFAAVLSTVNLLVHVPQAERVAEEDSRKRLAQELSRLQSTIEYLLLKGDASAAQHEIDCGTRRLQRRIVQRALRKRRRKAGRHQQHVALPQRHVEPFGEFHHHLARGRRTAGFDKAQMTGRNLGVACEIELAQVTALTPLAQVFADMTRSGTGGCGLCVHDGKISTRTSQLPLPRT